MKFTSKDIVYIIIIITLYLCIFLLKHDKPIPLNKINEFISLFVIVLLYNITPVCSFCLWFVYLLNKYINT